MPLAAGTFSAGAGVISLGFNIYKHLSEKANRSSGHKKLILRELRENIRLLERRDIVGINISKLIKELSNKEIVRGFEDNYKLKKIAPKNMLVTQRMIFRDYDNTYLEWDVGMILEKIDERIGDLHQIVNTFDNINDAPYNITAKLNNLFYLCIIAALLTKTV